MLNSITYRLLKTPSELEEAVTLQTIYWGNEADALVPLHMLLSLARYGGHIIGAYDGKQMVGLLMGFLGYDSDRHTSPLTMDDLIFMSKRMVVLPDYRGQQIGYNLKLKQRDLAIKMGVNCISWTFDPLLARNAHLNIRKLGGIIRHYIVNYFGESISNPTLSADRVVIEWRVLHPHVNARMSEKSMSTSLETYLSDGAVVINPIQDENSLPYPAMVTTVRDHDGTLLLEIPKDFVSLQTSATEVANRWRSHVRESFKSILDLGYIVTDFVREDYGELNRTFYVFNRHDNLKF